MFKIPMNIEKTIHVNMPIDKVYLATSDFNTWSRWSPWQILESNCDYKVSGAPHSLGHKSEWAGKLIGSGEMKIVGLIPNKSFSYSLLFLKPWKSVASGSIELESKNSGTQIVWKMNSSLPFFIFFLKKMMTAMLGADFERGLLMLKEHLEKGTVSSKVEDQGVQSGLSFYYTGIRKKAEIKSLDQSMPADFQKLTDLAKAGNFPAPDMVFDFTHDFNFVTGQCEYTAGFGYYKDPKISAETVTKFQLETGFIPEHKALKVNHIGSYKYLGNGWSGLMMHQRVLKFKFNKKIPLYEVYKNMPNEVSEENLITEIYGPLV